MKKTYADGSVVEGTPEEILTYEGRSLVPTSIPLIPAMLPASKSLPTEYEISWLLQQQQTDHNCLIRGFYDSHPGYTGAVAISCPCRRCTPTCLGAEVTC